MWEAIVEKVLTRYLSQYIDGIEREKLQVGLLSGDVELTDLMLKPETADVLDLPFSIVFGRIGKLSIGVSWTKWMAQNYDLRVSVEHVHLLLKPRELSHKKSATELREELRKAKERQIQHKEQQYVEAMREKDAIEKSKDNAGFLMRLTNRLLKNVQIDLKDLHIAFHDATRMFSLGCLLDVGSFFSCDTNWQRATAINLDDTVLSKAMDLKGLSIYGGTGSLDDWNALVSSTAEQTEVKQKASELLVQIQSTLSCLSRNKELESLDAHRIPSVSQSVSPSVVVSPLRSAFPSRVPLALSEPQIYVSPDAAVSPSSVSYIRPVGISNRLSHLASTDPTANLSVASSFLNSQTKVVSQSIFDYILLPLHLTFYFTSNTKSKDVIARLEVGKESEGISLSRTQLKTLLNLYREATVNRKRWQRLLLARSHLVRLDPESLETITKQQFVRLYWKRLQYQSKLAGHNGPLNESEIEWLQLFHDVVPVRHLARWRARCLWDAQNILAASEFKVQAEMAAARKQQSWWDWATQGSRAAETAALSKIEEQGGAQALFSEDEAKFMSDVVRTEISVESFDIPTKFRLSFGLTHFMFLLRDETYTPPSSSISFINNDSNNDTDFNPFFLGADFGDVRADLYLRSCVDRNDKEVYEWRWGFSMSDFIVKNRGSVVIAFNKAMDLGFSSDITPPSPRSITLISDFFGRQPNGTNMIEPTKYKMENAFLNSTNVDPTTSSQQNIDSRSSTSLNNSEQKIRSENSGYPYETPAGSEIVEGLSEPFQQQLAPSSSVVETSATFWSFEHSVTSEGNILSATLRVSPLEFIFKPEFLRDTLNFFMFEAGRTVQELERQDSPRIEGNEEFYDGMLENAEKLRAAANEKSPDLLRLDIILCAPIINWTTVEEGSIQMHLGQFRLQTPGCCRYNDIACTIEMNDTQITCISSTGKIIPILRPIPIRLHCQYYPATYVVNLDLVFYELFLEVNPEALVVLLAIPSSLTKPLLKSSRPSLVAATALLDSGSTQSRLLATQIEEPQRSNLPHGGSQDQLLTSAFELEEEDVELPNQPTSNGNSQLDERPRFTITSSIFINRVGCSLFGKQSNEVLRIAAVDLSVSGNFTPPPDEHAELVSEICVQLERIFISDPSTKTPLFLTLSSEERTIDTDELFGHVTLDNNRRSSVRFFESFSSKFHRPEGRYSSVSNDSSTSPDRFLTAVMSRSVDAETTEEFVDAIDSRIVTFEICYHNAPYNEFQVEAAPCEIHWQKDSITQIMQTVKYVRGVVEDALQKQIDSLRQNIRGEAAAEPGQLLLSQEAFGTIEQTLLYMKNTIASEEAEDQTTVATPNQLSEIIEEPIDTTDPVVTHGLSLDSPFPKFAADFETPSIPSYKIIANFRGAALQFWQCGVVFGRSELVDVAINFTGYKTGDAELEVGIGAVQMVLDGRRILTSSEQEVGDSTEYDMKDKNNFKEDRNVSVASCNIDTRNRNNERRRPFRNRISENSKHFSRSDSIPSKNQVLTSFIRFYSAPNPETGIDYPFSACMKGFLSRLTYVYLQRDLFRLLAYISDGILDVLLLRSYEAACQLVKSSYFLFAVHIDRPLFILPEDKSVVTQLQDSVVAASSGFQGSYFKSKKCNDEGSNRADIGELDGRFQLTSRTMSFLFNRFINTTPPLLNETGCSIGFDLGKLILRNAYTNRPIGNLETSLEEPKFGLSSTIFLQLEGLSASMNYSSLFGSFSKEIAGPVLEQVAVDTKLRAGDPFLVDLNFSEIRLRLSREQLTLILDILNENFAGLGYTPTAIELHDSTVQHTLSGSGASSKTSDLADVERDVTEILATPPLRISVRMAVEAIDLDVSFGLKRPMGDLDVRKIFIGCDVSLYPLYVTYKFVLLGESVVLNDRRTDSRNAYKRFLECLPPTMETAAEIPTEVSHLNYGAPPSYKRGDGKLAEPPGIRLQWMRPGIAAKKLNTNLRHPDQLDDFNDSETENTAAFLHSLGILFESSIKETTLRVYLSNPTVYVLTVGMQSLLDWIMSGFGFSTMRRFPKPPPPVITSGADSLSRNDLIDAQMRQIIPQVKPFLINVMIKKGTFEIFSRVEHLAEPVLQWQNDLYFSAESIGQCLLFKRIEITGCQMQRIDVRPLIEALSREKSEVQGEEYRLKQHYFEEIIASDIYEPPKALFDVVGRVVICENFSILSSGSIETLYDPIQQQHERMQVGRDRSSRISSVIDSATSYSRSYGLDSSIKRIDSSSVAENVKSDHLENHSLIEKRKDRQNSSTSYSIRADELADPSQYIGRTDVVLSQLQLDLDIPEFALRVSSRDLAVLISALRSIQSDYPAAFDDTPSPPIIPYPSINKSEPSPSIADDTENSAAREEALAFLVGSPAPSRRASRASSVGGGRTAKDSSSTLRVDRFCRFGFRFGTIDLVILDDLRATICPILKTTIKTDQLFIHLNPNLFHLSLLGLRTRVDYLSPKVGDWEPFIEKFNISVTYRTLYNAVKGVVQHENNSHQYQQALLNESSSCCNFSESKNVQSVSQSNLPKYPHVPGQHHITAQNVMGASADFSLAPTALETTRTLTAYTNSPHLLPNSNLSLRSAPSWKNFVPDTTVSIFSLSPLWVNITPQLCQLMMWFVPTLSGYITAATLVTDELADVSLTQELRQTDSAINHLVNIPSSLDALDVGSISILDNEDDQVDSASFRYINLSGQQFIAFSTLGNDESLIQQPSLDDSNGWQPPPQIAAIVRILPSSSSRSLDDLTAGLRIASVMQYRKSQRQFDIFIAPEPPGTEIDRLNQMFPQLQRDYILRNLMVTKDENKTLETLLAITQAGDNSLILSNEGVSVDPSPPFMGPFPKTMEVVPVILSRQMAVSLPAPLRRLKTHHLYSEPKASTSSTPNNVQNTNAHTPIDQVTEDEEVEMMGPSVGLIGLDQRSSKVPSSRDALSPQAIAATSASSHPDGHIINQVVGTVLSPHPSYKLFLITTCVRVHNKTSIPLEVAFLNRDKQAILLTNIRSRCAPISILDPQENPQITLVGAAVGQQQTSTNTLQPITICHSSYPHLSYDPNLMVRQQNEIGISYSIIVPVGQFLSVPQNAFIGQSRVLMIFRPAALAEINSSGKVPAKIDCRAPRGWTNLVDSQVDSGTDHTFIRSSKFTAGVSTTQASSGSAIFQPLQMSSILSRHRIRLAENNADKYEELFFSILRNEIVSSMPSEQPIVNLSIFPSMTIVNACPTPMDCLLLPETRTQPIDAIGRSPSSPSFFGGFQAVPETRALEPLKVVIAPFTIFHVYNTPPVIPGTSLGMKLKLSLIGRAEWSEKVKFIFPPSKEETVSRLQLRCAGFAPVEVEILKDPNDFVGALAAIQKGQQACVISSPRWFVDRTGLGIKASRIHRDPPRFFPIFDSVALLGDSKEAAIELALPGLQASSNPRVTVEIPAIGSYTQTDYRSGNKVYTFCIQTERIAPSDTGGAISRCVIVTPRYLLHNGFESMELFIRQYKAPGEPIAVQPGETIPLYWTKNATKFLFQFKPGDAYGYSWSGPISPSEEFAGSNQIALQNGMTNKPEVFHVQLSPQRGVICVVIKPSVVDPKESSSSVVLTNRLNGVNIAVKTYHPNLPSEDRMSELFSVVSFSFDTNDARQLHQKSNSKAMVTSDMDEFTATPYQSVTLAWPSPFIQPFYACELTAWSLEGKPITTPFQFQISRRYRMRNFFEILAPNLPYGKIVVGCETRGNVLYIDVVPLNRPSVGPRTLLSPVHTSGIQSPRLSITESASPAPSRNLQLSIDLSQIGLSLVSDRLREELLFAEVTQCNFYFLRKDEERLYDITLADIQIDSQLEESEKPVLLANRGGVDQAVYENRSRWVENSQSSIPAVQSAPVPLATSAAAVKREESVHRKSKSVIGVVDTQDKQQRVPYFLHFHMERESASSCDLHLKNVTLSLDDLEIDIDAEMLNGIHDFIKECLETLGSKRSYGTPRSVVVSWTQFPIHINYIPPLPNQIIVLDRMRIQRFTAVLWCSFLLDKTPFLSDTVKMGLRILMVSQKLELKGAPLQFEPELVTSTIRGSLSTLLMMVKDRYMAQVVNSIAVVLGYSSLFNIPRVPLDLLRGTVGFGLTVADNLTSGIGTILSNLTFDSEYINQRQKERATTSRTTSGIKDGFNAATKDLKEGFKSLGEIVTKPIGGAQRDGFAGLMKGVAKGVVGTIVKPVDKLGQAVSSMASGIRAEYLTKPLGGYKSRTIRRRKPRMLWGDTGRIKEYDINEAELRECLGLQMAKNVLKSITISIREANPPQHLALLIYPKRICFTDLYGGRGRLSSQLNGDEELATETTAASVVGRAKTLWSVDLATITSVRASTHGVAVNTPRRVRQIMCTRGTLIKQLYEEISSAERRVKATLQIGRVSDWTYSNQV